MQLKEWLFAYQYLLPQDMHDAVHDINEIVHITPCTFPN